MKYVFKDDMLKRKNELLLRYCMTKCVPGRNDVRCRIRRRYRNR